MIPVLYDKFESAFNSAGLGMLSECTRCEVTEEVNGVYELEFDYPADGEFYEQLLNVGGSVGVIHDHNGDIQPFDIYKYSAPIDGIVTFYASHISYRLKNYIKHPQNDIYSYDNPGNFFFLLGNQHSNPSTLSDIPGTFAFWNQSSYQVGDGTLIVPPVFNVREALLNREDDDRYPNGSFVQVWDGEFTFKKTVVIFKEQRGQNRGVQILHGKNMAGIIREKDSGDIISEVTPIWTDGNGNTTIYSTLRSTQFEKYESPWQAHPSGKAMTTHDTEIIWFRPIDLRGAVYDLTELFENQPTASQARKAAQNYMSKNSTWRAVDNIEIDFIDLYDSPEYEDIKEIEKFDVGDRVTVSFPELGVHAVDVEIMSGTFDVLGERFTQMQLSTIRTTLAQLIIDTVR